MSENVKYFGYGANRDPKMIAAILGMAEADVKGTPAFLEGYDMAVQRLDQVPDSVSPTAPANISPRDLLMESWGEDFLSYVIMPNPEGRVSGVIWELTSDERERMRDWELVDFGWYEDCEGTARTANGQVILVMSQRLGIQQSVDHIVDGLNYETWLDSPAKFIEVAEKARREYDSRNMIGPEGTSYHRDITQS